MGLKGDTDEVIRVWRGYPWRLKAWLLLSLFLASGSIASLSEVVFKWKLFFLDAVTFYRNTVSAPIQRALEELLHLRLPPQYGECLLLFLLLFGANLRLVFHGSPTSKSNILAFGVCLSLPILFFVAPILDARPPTLLSTLITLGSVAALQTFLYFRLGGAARILWFVYLLGPPLFVAFAGAINAGLQRVA